MNLYQIVSLKNQLEQTLSPVSTQKINLKIRYQAAKPGDCGLGCVVMLLNYYGKTITIESLKKKYKKSPYYIDPAGWTHQGLVDICNTNNASAKAYRFKSMRFIVDMLEKGKPLIVSLRVPGIDNLHGLEVYQKKNSQLTLEGHLCLVSGVNDGLVVIQDPRNIGIHGKNTKVPIKTLLNIFTGNCIS